MKKIFVSLSMLVLMGLISCRKEVLSPDHAGLPWGASMGSSVRINQGLLDFNDFNDLESYVSGLESEIQKQKAVNPGLEEDEILQKIESDLGFYSLRMKLQKEFEAMEEKGFSTLEEIPDYSWLRDPLLRSVFSPDAAVIVNGDIYVYLRPDVSFLISGLDFGKLKEISGQMPPHDAEIKNLVGFANRHQIKLFSKKVFYGKSNGIVSSNRNIIIPQPVMTVVDCQPMLFNFYDGYIMEVDTTDTTGFGWNIYTGGVKAEIDWGDGSPITTVMDYQGEIGASHLYQTVGTYTYIVKTYILNYPGIPPGQIYWIGSGTVIVNSTACKELSYDSPGIWKSATLGNDKWALRATVWKHDNVFSRRAGAQSEAFVWNSNKQKWISRKANYLFTKVEADLRSASCVLSYNIVESDGDNNRKSIAVRKSGLNWLHLADGDLHSYHKLEAGGSRIEANLKVNVCPTNQTILY